MLEFKISEHDRIIKSEKIERIKDLTPHYFIDRVYNKSDTEMEILTKKWEDDYLNYKKNLKK